MRCATLLGFATVVVCVGPLFAQDDLSALSDENALPVTLEFQDANLADALVQLAGIGGFRLQLTPGVRDASPVTGRFEDAALASVLRSVLDATDVNYRVVERTLIVGAPANAFLDSPFALKNPRPGCSRKVYHLC